MQYSFAALCQQVYDHWKQYAAQTADWRPPTPYTATAVPGGSSHCTNATASAAFNCGAMPADMNTHGACARQGMHVQRIDVAGTPMHHPHNPSSSAQALIKLLLMHAMHTP